MKVALNGAKGNPALIALAYESEPGEKNSLGFGILSAQGGV
jgi:CRISPR/Cas system endoribonuclease Cas6 (RAMP superfamily)